MLQWVVSFASAARSILEVSQTILTPIFTCCYSKATRKMRKKGLFFLLRAVIRLVKEPVVVVVENGQQVGQWQAGCVFRLYCCSTVWPASQYNSQTIPCCYSIARTADMRSPALSLLLSSVVHTRFILWASRPQHVLTRIHFFFTIINVPVDVQPVASCADFAPVFSSRRGCSPSETQRKCIQYTVVPRKVNS